MTPEETEKRLETLAAKVEDLANRVVACERASVPATLEESTPSPAAMSARPWWDMTESDPEKVQVIFGVDEAHEPTRFRPTDADLTFYRFYVGFEKPAESGPRNELIDGDAPLLALKAASHIFGPMIATVAQEHANRVTAGLRKENSTLISSLENTPHQLANARTLLGVESRNLADDALLEAIKALPKVAPKDESAGSPNRAVSTVPGVDEPAALECDAAFVRRRLGECIENPDASARAIIDFAANLAVERDNERDLSELLRARVVELEARAGRFASKSMIRNYKRVLMGESTHPELVAAAKGFEIDFPVLTSDIRGKLGLNVTPLNPL